MFRIPIFVPALWLAAAPVLAQPDAPPRRADPLDARAPVPPLVYRALPAPRGAAETPPLPWREANDTVRAVGGWRSYAREAAAAASAPPPRQP